MTDEIYKGKFFNRSFTPAWHGLGINAVEDHTATELAQKLGIPIIKKLPLYIFPEGKKTKSNLYGLWRMGTELDPGELLGTCGEKYRPVGVDRFCQIWDDNVSRPVETMGSLKKGSILFVTTGLPDFTLGDNDEIRNYLIAFSPMNGRDAIEVLISSVRVVCNNTLQASRSMASETFKVQHFDYAEDDLAGWLNGLYGRAESRVNALKSAYGNMTTTQLGKTEAVEYFHKVYAYPDLPRGFEHLTTGTIITDQHQPSDYVPPSIVERLIQRNNPYNATVNAVEKARQAVENLFDGRGLGMNYETANNTVWGAYNAVSEWETHRRSRKLAGAENLLIGDRARTISRAYDLAMELVPVKA